MLGPFEEEEEGTGIGSDVVKVMGEDPGTPGLLPKGIDPGTVTIPQCRVNKTKQHTDFFPARRVSHKGKTFVVSHKVTVFIACGKREFSKISH